MPQVEATDLIMVKVETVKFEGLHHEIEVKDPSIVSVSFKIIAIREVHHNKIVLNTAMLVSPIFRGIRATLIEAEAMAVDLNISEVAVVVGPIIRTTLECISISITHMTNNQNNMVLPAVYVLQYVYVGYWLEKRRSSYVLLLYVFILSAMLYILSEHAQY